jgi:hypothetical protein
MNESICWVNQKTLGLEFGVGPKVIGKWLTEAGLRTEARTPTIQALEKGYAKPFLTDAGISFFKWDKLLTVETLRRAGHRPRNAPTPRMIGPFRSSARPDGSFDVLGTDGVVAVVEGQENTERICWLLDLAWKHGKLD